MTADGKIAPVNRHFQPFAGERDKEHLLELRATADAVMAGARTVDLDKVNLGPGPTRFREQRVNRGLAEYNLRVIVSGGGTIDPKAEVFKHRFSPIIILTTARATKSARTRLSKLADDIQICGRTELNFSKALNWLRDKWKVKRLLCEGGGEVNGALFRDGLVDEINLTVAPTVLGGRHAPTLSDGMGISRLANATRFRLRSMKKEGESLFLVYRQ